MVSTIKNMGFKVKTYASKSRPDQLNIAFCHIGFWKWIRENCGTYSDNKRIPNFILGASREQLKTLLFAMIQGDGSWHKHGSQGAFSYHTTSKKLNDQLHEICLKLGIALVTRAVDRSKEGWKTIYISSGHFDHKHLIHPDTQISFVSYSGRVSCFTVPNGLLVTRRNGRVLISGNSSDYNRATSDTARKLADEQVFAPERDEFDDFINRILFPEMGVVYHSFRSNSPNTTDNSELVQILSNAEKTGGMTPRRADLVLRDILGRDLPPFAQDENFNLDLPFSLSMAEAVKNKADAAEPGQQVTALKRLQQIDGIVGGGAGGAEVAKTLLAIRGELERQWAELNIVPNHKHDE